MSAIESAAAAATAEQAQPTRSRVRAEHAFVESNEELALGKTVLDATRIRPADSAASRAGEGLDRYIPTVKDGRKLAYPWIWLLTDYGRRDGFVASCHGVIARIAPSARVGDITHEVPARDIRHGAAVLAQTVPYLPSSVVVGVVDPGVGTSRRAIALTAGEIVLIGPDNGLLLWAADSLGGVSAVVALTEQRYVLDTAARTFAGRDIFAPAAAHLTTGVPLAEFGPALMVEDLVYLPTPRVMSSDGILDTEVLSVDRFGNVQLCATVADLNAAVLDSGVVQIGVQDRSYSSTVGITFADVPLGDLVLFIDSAGQVALAVNGGDAASTLDLRPGDGVILTW